MLIIDPLIDLTGMLWKGFTFLKKKIRVTSDKVQVTSDKLQVTSVDGSSNQSWKLVTRHP